MNRLEMKDIVKCYFNHASSEPDCNLKSYKNYTIYRPLGHRWRVTFPPADAALAQLKCRTDAAQMQLRCSSDAAHTVRQSGQSGQSR